MRSVSRYSSENAAEAITFQIANAEGYVRMGKEKEALLHLHEFIKQRRNHQFEKKSFERLMMYYMNLCVKRQEHRLAKDGLYQYRTLCQNTDPKSLETVIIALLRMAETKAEEARQRADDRALTEAAKIPDLDDDEALDQHLLDAYEEGLKSQTDKEIVVPWRKFRWEMYRTVMELLAKNQKFQELYHSTCKAAFDFCKEYQRHREFRHLSEMLTKHLQELEKQQAVGKQKVVFEWTPENIRLHLDTRCAQLRVATELELWNEAYKIVGDIDKILSKDNCPPEVLQEKLAEYELLLSRLFWASEDHLFHASALYMHYTLTREQLQPRRDAEAATKLKNLASAVLLAALSIPRLDSTDPKKSVETSEALEYAAKLLRFNVKPSRKALLADLVSKGLLNEVYPELQQLHHALEEKFDPLGMVQAVLPALRFVQESGIPNLSMYTNLLEKVIVLRLITQLSTVYSDLRIEFVKGLLQPLSMSFCEVEKLLINAVADGVLNLRLDHRNRCIKFVAGSAAVHAMHGQLYRVATKLQRVAHRIHAQGAPEAIEADRRRFLQTVFQAAENEHRLLAERMELIEKRNETLRRQEEKRREEDKAAKEAEERRRKEEENRRRQKEAEERDRERLEQAQKDAQAKKVQDLFQRLGRPIDQEEAKRLVQEGRHKEELQEQQRKQAKQEDQRRKRLASQLQRLDYLTRAIRMEEAPVLEQQYERQTEEDRRMHQQRYEELVQKSRTQHAKDLEMKHKFQKMQAFRAEFDAVLTATQKPVFLQHLQEHREKKIEQAREQKTLDMEKRMMIEEQRRQQSSEEQRRREREREELEQARREEQARAAAAAAPSEEESWRRVALEPAPAVETSRAAAAVDTADTGADEVWTRAGARPRGEKPMPAMREPRRETESAWRRQAPADEAPRTQAPPPAEPSAPSRADEGPWRRAAPAAAAAPFEEGDGRTRRFGRRSEEGGPRRFEDDRDRRFAPREDDRDRRFAPREDDRDRRFAPREDDRDRRSAPREDDRDRRFAPREDDRDRRGAPREDGPDAGRWARREPGKGDRDKPRPTNSDGKWR